ncbi:MAG TPA: Gfo/Idh/MocA family oxidoreductase [Solirubrobacteraceae bacterium]|jgi:predicted dehydrogenase|nr:Gfo/Idh/MocA family oxidoreductase [Solirubrobacteraceae bacterium]
MSAGSVLPEVGIGIVGYGMMGKAHSYGYTLAAHIRTLGCRPRLRMISGRHREAVQDAARTYGVERAVTDWREVVTSADVEIVDICTPPGTHAEIVEAAAEAGKAIVCEKPLAADYDGARRAAAAVRRAGVRNAICFNYRKLPALALMKQLIDEGRIGQPRLWRATWLSDEFLDPELPFDWRFRRSQGASTIADLGAHLIDLAGWMVGAVESVSAQSQTFVSERHDRERGRDAMTEVDNDDASSALLRFRSGALGVFETAKVSPRRPCDFVVDVNGSRGTLRFDYARLNELWYGDADEPAELYGMRRIRAEHATHPQTQGWWPIGQGIGYGASFVNQTADLLAQWPDGSWSPDLETGRQVQAVCEAIEQAASQRRWVDVAEIADSAGV